MTSQQVIKPSGPFQALRQFARREPLETCNVCHVPVAPKHVHLLDVANRKVLCACQACSLAFSGTYKRIPQRARWLRDFQLADDQWDSLMIPINVAFFFQSSSTSQVIGLYPSPAGAIQSALRAEQWSEIAANNPGLRDMEADVEALLVNRLGQAKGHDGPAYYILPIDECFRLVGLVRTHWRGLSGGTEVWREIGGFFSEMRERSCRT
jgi:uncharacterized protein DUF5947